PVVQVTALGKEIRDLKSERSALQQELERIQALAKRRGVVLSRLSDIRREFKWEVLEVRRSTPASFDLRGYARNYAANRLKILGPTQPGAPESYEKEALDFF